MHRILADGMLLRPNPHTGLLWLTDLPKPDRAILGLTSHTLLCDRTEYRFTVEEGAMLRWVDWCRTNRVPRVLRDSLEGPGTKPLHWWVATEPVTAVAWVGP